LKGSKFNTIPAWSPKHPDEQGTWKFSWTQVHCLKMLKKIYMHEEVRVLNIIFVAITKTDKKKVTKFKRFNFNTLDENLTATKGVSEDKRLWRLSPLIDLGKVNSYKSARMSYLTDSDFSSRLLLLLCGSDWLDPLVFDKENRPVEFDMIGKQMNWRIVTRKKQWMEKNWTVIRKRALCLCVWIGREKEAKAQKKMCVLCL